MRVLLSAYACEPDKGSEPEVGWKLALNLAGKVQVVVLTRANNKVSIQKALSNIAPENRPEFLYYDLGKPLLLIKKLLKAHRWYYLIWQKSAARQVSRLISSTDVSIVHHATYASFRYPTAVLGHRVPAIWGPVGGVEATPWNLMPWSHPLSLLYEVARNTGIARRKFFPVKQWARYARVLAATDETHKFFSSRGIATSLLPAIGLDEDIQPEHGFPTSQLRLLYVGPLHYLKGVQFAIAALADVNEVTLTVVGAGNFESALRRTVRKHGVQDRVLFTGQIARSKLELIYSTHDVFAFPSLHDSGGMAVLEAMNAGLPVICLDCGGPALSVCEACGFKIPVGSKRSIIRGIRDAIGTYQSDPSLIETHGRAARERVKARYSWEFKTDHLLNVYQEVLGEGRAKCLSSQLSEN
jgi:glycosyltransferase involved in cell wall biosynthesis